MICRIDIHFKNNNGQTSISVACGGVAQSRQLQIPEFVTELSRDNSPNRFWLTKLLSSQQQELEDKGAQIFSQIISSDTEQEYYRKATTGRNSLLLVIHENATTAPNIPWELAFDGNNFLSRSERVTLLRVPDDSSEEETEKKTQCHAPLTVLFCCAQPQAVGPTFVQNLQIGFAQATAGLFSQGLLEITNLEHCTRSALTDTLRHKHFDIIVFYGHGYPPTGDSDGGLLLEDGHGGIDKLSAGDLSDMVFQRPPTLCFLNACSGAALPSEQQDNDLVHPDFSDVARVLSVAGVSACIASQSVVAVSVAIEFMRCFFSDIQHQLNASSMLDIYGALRHARNALATPSTDNPANNEKETQFIQQQSNAFYQYVVICSSYELPAITIKQPERIDSKVITRASSSIKFGSSSNIFVPRNHLAIGFEQLALEHSHLGIYGLGGMGKTSFARLWCLRLLQTAQPALRVDHAIWLDISVMEHSGVAALQQQMLAWADMVHSKYGKYLLERDVEVGVMAQVLQQCYPGKVILVLDNVESLLADAEHKKTAEYLDQLLDLTGWRSFWTSRATTSSALFPRANTQWRAANRFDYYEAAALIYIHQQDWDQLDIEASKKSAFHARVIQNIAIHPYALVLFLRYAKTQPDKWTDDSQKELARYADISFYLDQRSPDEKILLHLLDCLDTPVPSQYLTGTCIPALGKDLSLPETLLQGVDTSLQVLLGSALVESDDGSLSLLPVVSRELRDSHAMDGAQRALYVYHLAVMNLKLFQKYKNIAKDKANNQETRHAQNSHKQASWFVEQACRLCLQQHDWELIAVVLQALQQPTHGLHPYLLKSFSMTTISHAKKAREHIELDRYVAIIGPAINHLYHGRFYTEALNGYQQLLQEVPNHQSKGITLHQMGMVYQEQRQWQQALDHYQMAVDSKRSSAMEHQIGNSLHQIGMVYEEQRQWQQALDHYQMAVAAKRSSAMEHQIGNSLHQMGMVYQQQRQWQQALEHYQMAVAAKRSSAMEHQIGTSLHQMGMVYQQQRQWQQALEHYQMAVESKRSSAMEHQIGNSLHQMGMVYEEQRQWQQALEHYQMAVESKRSSAMEHEIGSSLHQMGMVYQQQRQWQQALEHYQMAVDSKRSSAMEHEIGGSLYLMGWVYQELAEYTQALEYSFDALKSMLRHPYIPEHNAIVFRQIQRLQSQVQPEAWQKRYAAIQQEFPDALAALEKLDGKE